ncbi:MAG: SMC family ATPase, partial [Clostridia bacterium]|nr:SMC family ATPase [Clostridia bacterium]
MQPISLTIYGINSFKTEQKIDFSALPSGFFGIFGQTGSGKSTILDAITIALYGKTERAKRAIEFICASCDSASVKLVFNASKNGAIKTYMVERFFKKKKDDQTVDSSAVFYEKQGDRFAVTCEGVSAVDDAVKNKLGLSFSEFSKCIALPQGQFANFLNATSSERTNIVSNIFNLSKYGAPLQNSVSEKEQDLSVKLAEINGKLTQINDVSEENIKEIKSSLFAIKDEIELLEIDLKQKTEKLNKLKEIKFLLSQQEEAKKIEKLLLDKNNEMQELKEKLLKAKKVLPLFEKVKEAESLNAEILNLQNEFGNKKTELFSISKEYENIINESDIFNKNYSETYNALLEKQNNLNGLTSKKLEIEKLNKKLEELNIEINNINNEIKNYQEELYNNSIIRDELQKKLDNINIKIKDKNVDTNIVLQIKKGAELKAQMEMLDKVMLLVDNERVVLVSRINELLETLKAYELKFKEQANNGDFNFEENENVKNEYEEIISKINSIKIENKENISTPNLLNE